MTDYGNNNQKQTPSHAYANVPPRGNETALMIEGLYNGLSYDLQKMKKELMNELKYNALQASSLYQSVQKETESSVETNAQTAQSMVRELKYGYQQNQMIYESLSGILKDDVLTKLETVEGKVELLEEIDKALAEIKEKLDELASRTTPDYESLVDYDKITETVIEKTESSIASHNKEVLDAVAAIPVAENIDYTRIVEEVSEKVAELVRDGRTAEATAVPADVDYERIVYGTAEKVVESLPYPEKVDYRRIDENFIKAAESIKPAALDEEVLAANIAAAVAQAISEMDPETLAEAVASKIALPEVQAPEIDYEKLSDMIIAKMPAPADPEPIDYDRLADAVAARMSEAVDYDRISETVAERTPQPEAIDYAVMAQNIVEQMPQPEEIDYAVMAQNIAERMPQAEAIDYDRVYQAAKAAEVIPDPVDYDRIAEIVEAGMSNESDYDIVVDEEGAEKIARCVADGIDYKGISEMVTEGIDYKGISDKVTEGIDYEGLSEKVVEKIVMPEVEVPKPEEIDYDLLSEMVAQKVVVPQPEPPTYDVVVDEEGAKSIAENVVSAIDMESVTDKVAEKIVVPQPEQIEIDYETLSDKVAEKIVVPQPEKTEIDYETLSDEVAGKISLPAFDILVDEEGAGKIADAVVEKMKAECPMSEKAAAQEEVAEEAQTEAAEEAPAEAEEISETAEESVAEEAAEEVCEEVAEEAAPAVEEPAEAVEEAEPVAEEVAEEAETVEEAPVEEIPVEEEVTAEETAAEETAAEETAATEEPAEEPVEETAPEELLSEGGEIVSSSQSTIETEIAVTTAEAAAYEEAEGDNLVDADTGLVIRLKRSFTAKMKQSDPAVKQYYSDIKNELTSYKRLNSNLSWHGDRFNFGRDTVAKLNICGKTLCFYLALDPNDPEYKTTVYHQRDVGGQRAYESTPFMVKVKSDAGLKKALRLVGFLAEKLGTEKRDNFETVDYVEEFRHESTKQLLEEGLIKVTKEKKVVLDFN